MKLVGIAHYKGTYDGKPYDTYHLHFTSPIPPDKGDGVAVEMHKIKAVDMPFLPSIGDDLKLYFDKFKRLIGFAIE